MIFFNYKKLKNHSRWRRLTAIIFCNIIQVGFAMGQPAPNRSSRLEKLSINAGASYGADNFSWSIAGNINGEDPNILSELVYKDIQRVGAYVNIQFKFSDKVSFEWFMSMKRAFSGNAIDTDYAKDNRTKITNQLLLKSDKGLTNAFSGRVIYSFYKGNKTRLQATAGFGLTKSDYHLSDLRNDRLNSSYMPVWNYPFLGVRIVYAVTQKIIIAGATEVNYLNYNAEANWNLIEEFQHPLSFNHRANGIGFTYSMDGSYKITTRTKIMLSGNYVNWKTKAGIDKLYLKTGEIFQTRLNPSKRNVKGLSIGIAFSI